MTVDALVLQLRYQHLLRAAHRRGAVSVHYLVRLTITKGPGLEQG
jgi:hypothetical protein